MAAEDNLEILIVARDQASKTIKGIGNSLKGAFKVGAVAAVGGLGLLTAGLGLFITQGMEGQRVQAALNAVLASTKGVAGLTADELNAMSDSLSRVTPFAQDTITEAQTLLLTFTKIGEDVFPRATETVLNMATVFGSTESASIQLGKALNDPVAGIGALSEVGVSFTEEQKKLVEQLVATGDIAGAQAIILNELETEFGGAARAAGNTFGGKLTILKNKLMDVVEALGMAMLPALTDMVDFILDDILPGIEKFGAKLQPAFWYAGVIVKNFVSILMGGGGLGEALRWVFTVWDGGESVIHSFLTRIGVADRKAMKIATTLQDIVVPALDFFRDTLAPFISEHLPAIKNALIAVGAVLAGAAIAGGILSIVAAIGAFASGIGPIILLIGLLAAAWTEDWGGIRTWTTETLWPALEPILSDIKDFIETNIPAAIDTLKTAWEDVLMPAITTLVTYWNDFLKPMLLDGLGWYFTEYVPAVIEILKKAWEDVLIPAIDGLVTFWNDTLKPAFEDISTWLSTTIPLAITLAKLAWDLVFKPALNRIVSFWNDDLKPAFDEIKTFLEITIPAAMIYAKNAWTGLKNKMTDIHNFWETTLKPTFDKIVEMVDTTLKDAVDIGKGVIDDLKTAFDQLIGPIDSVWSAIDDVVSKLDDLKGGVPDWLIPGSPTPFELGIVGITDAMKSWNREMSALNNNMSASPIGKAAASMQAITNNNQPQYNLTINSNARNENVRSQFNMMRTWGRL